MFEEMSSHSRFSSLTKAQFGTAFGAAFAASSHSRFGSASSHSRFRSDSSHSTAIPN
ncbi:hypothetical protein RchiOBHm_Chr5g0042911 [Rosa chinensis]|uniref:Uncharacterized protein n=1 Tax=Rosa chinensis TaxID=74649 RepID=A0A2P6QD63_ROSCH|nr:hypothetical protein RchiOBHm_Chr5g0042911 [Rosa chinensis]